MAVDITLLFKASVKTVKTRNKALGVAAAAGDNARDELLKRSAARSKSDFTGRAREVVSHIGKLKDFLLQHRKDYINAYSHIMSDYVRMTDTERDQIDQDAQVFMRTCADAIHQLRTEGVCKLYSEQRAIRVKRVIDKKRLSRLEPEPTSVSQSPLSPEKSSQNLLEDSEEKLSAEENKDRNLPDAQSNLGLWGDGKGEDELSPEEIQMFEQENQRLVGEMNNLFDEVRQIEGKVVEISRLQEIFTEKVLQQETDIDNIHQLVVGATENIKEGNEDIREAIKNNAGFRVWILFFLVMCSFSLLFLDWYDN
ncbi:syntaxin-18 isoform 2-T2 [Guaruba guarouba]